MIEFQAPKRIFRASFGLLESRRPSLGSSAARGLLRNWRKMLSADFRVVSPGSGTAAGRGLPNGGREGVLLERVEGDARAGVPPAGGHAATVLRLLDISSAARSTTLSAGSDGAARPHRVARGRGDASSAAAAPCGVGAQMHAGAQGRGPSMLCSASSSGTEHHRAEWLSVNGGARTAGRSPRPLQRRVRPLWADIRRLQADRASGDAIVAVPRCGNRPCGARSAATAPHSPTQPDTARHSRRSVRDARNDYRCARATARAWARR